MFKLLQQLTRLTPVLQGFLVGVSCLLAQNALANPTQITPLTREGSESFSNTIAPNVSPIQDENTGNLPSPTSYSAADLTGVSSVTLNDTKPSYLLVGESSWVRFTFPQNQNPYIAGGNSQENLSNPDPSLSPTESITEENSQDNPPEAFPELSPSSSEATQSTEESERWHFSFQPYATIPFSTYGTATARGRTVNYHLSTAQLFQLLRVTGSARVEAWKGRLGFIVDGYFVSLGDIGNLQKSVIREPNFLSALNFLLSRDANGKIQEIVNGLDRDIQVVETIQELREEQVFQQVKDKAQDLRENVAQKAEKLRELKAKIDEVRERFPESGNPLRDLVVKIQDLPEVDLGEIKDNVDIRDLRRLQEKLQDLRQDPSFGVKIEDLGELRQKLVEMQELLAKGQEKIQQLREIKDSEPLKQLEEKIQNTQESIQQVVQRLDQVKDFQENRDTQQLDAESTTNLQFDQGIYDFALSYHFGDSPMYELPDKPSNKPFPLIWFEPIAGVRLNSISVNIDQTLNVKLSSSLVNFTQTFQQSFNQGRTWFEPMLGGKFGVQVSDPVTLWLRGDVSGFGLAGDTDLSWNIFFGVDLWVRSNISLQLAYRFYEINYKNGSGDNAFGFTENFNGPFLSATFHF